MPVRLLNLSDKPRKIKKGTPLATCEPVLSVIQTTCKDNLAQANVSELGPLPREQLVTWCHVMIKRMHCMHHCMTIPISFQGAKRPDLAEHRIDIGDAPTLRQAPRRLPLFEREEAQREPFE